MFKKIRKYNFLILFLFLVVLTILLNLYFSQKEKNKLTIILPSKTVFALQLNTIKQEKQSFLNHLFSNPKSKNGFDFKKWLNQNPAQQKNISFISQKFNLPLLSPLINSQNQLFSLLNKKLIIIGLKNNEDTLKLIFISPLNLATKKEFLKAIKKYPHQQISVSSLSSPLYKVFFSQPPFYFYYTFFKKKIIFSFYRKEIEDIVYSQSKKYLNSLIKKRKRIEKFNPNFIIAKNNNVFLKGFLNSEKINIALPFVKNLSLKAISKQEKIYFFGKLSPKEKVSLNFYTPKENFIFQKEKEEEIFLNQQKQILSKLSLNNEFVFVLAENNFKNKIKFLKEKIKNDNPKNFYFQQKEIKKIEKKYQINLNKEIIPFFEKKIYLFISSEKNPCQLKNISLKTILTNNNFVLVTEINKEINLALLEKAIAKIFAYQFPSEKEKLLPDQTKITEIIAEPAKFLPKNLDPQKPIKVIKTPLFNFYLVKEKKELILTNSLEYLKTAYNNFFLPSSKINKDYLFLSSPNPSLWGFKKIFLFNYWQNNNFFSKIFLE